MRAAGHDAATVREQQLGGAVDERVAEVVRAEERIFVTLDLDFADLRVYPPALFAGLLVLRLRRQGPDDLVDLLRELLPILERESVRGELWIVSAQGIRRRRDIDPAG